MFPTLQKNQSPFAILPNFIKCLGVKIDAAQVHQDCFTNSTNWYNIYSQSGMSTAGKAGKHGCSTSQRVSRFSCGIWVCTNSNDKIICASLWLNKVCPCILFQFIPIAAQYGEFDPAPRHDPERQVPGAQWKGSWLPGCKWFQVWSGLCPWMDHCSNIEIRDQYRISRLLTMLMFSKILMVYDMFSLLNWLPVPSMTRRQPSWTFLHLAPNWMWPWTTISSAARFSSIIISEFFGFAKQSLWWEFWCKLVQHMVQHHFWVHA